VQFSKLLGNNLKSEEVIEFLEHFDIDVVYDFDRTFEGMDDVYWAQFYKQGFEFRFNEKQNLDIAFLYILAREGFSPIDKSEIDVAIYNSYAEAMSNFKFLEIEYISSPIEDPSHKHYQGWIKSIHNGFTAHYEFINKELLMITLNLGN
jgi:hypothetical protein